MPSRTALALAAAAAVSSANAFQGFNYGNTFTDGSIKAQSDYEEEFTTAANLEGTNGAFTSARLYTMIQGGTANEPNAAIPAAISTGTSLLFGLWASAGQEAFNNELAALQNTIDQYCDQLDGLIAGISVGSEDLYRITPTGIANGENPGVGPDVLVNYINEVRDTISGSCLSDAPIGHVDTWTAWVNGSNSAVIEACDWLGMDAYPYFETTESNGIQSGAGLFQDALGVTQNAAGGKDVWITETGWPVSGDESGQAVANLENARTFWEDVGCPLFGSTNVWWYTLQDSAPDTPNPSFGVIGSELTRTPLYDLSCDGSSGGGGGGGDDDDDTTTSEDPTSSPPPATTSEDEPEPTNDDPPASSTTNDDVTSEEPITSTDNSTTALPTTGVDTTANSTMVTTPSSPTTDTPAPSSDNGGSSPEPTSPGSGEGDGGSAPTESTPPGGSNQLNSFGAAAAAVVIAAALL